MIEKQIEEIKSLIEKTVSIPTPPVLGKVEKVYEVAGKSDFLNCLYSADVRLIELTLKIQILLSQMFQSLE